MIKYLLAALLVVPIGASFAAETVTLRIAKTDGTIERKVRKLTKEGDNVYRLHVPAKELTAEIEYVDVVSERATARTGEPGYFVTSDGRLGTFHEHDGKLEVRANPMPIFGMKNTKGALVGIVKGLRHEFKTVVEVESGAYAIYPRFLIKDIVFAPYEDLVVDLYTLDGDDADYSGMARAYRDYQLGRGEVKPLKERITKSPQLKYAVGAMAIRVGHGSKPRNMEVEDQTLETEPKMNVHVTFEELQEMMRKLKEMGVDEAEFCTVGWNIRGHDGRYPQLFPVEPALGGEEKLRETIRLAHDLGYQIVCHTNYTDAYKIADCWSEDFIAKRPDGSLRKGWIWAGGRSYSPCAKCVYESFARKDFANIAALGYKGLHHIDVISCIPPRDCHDPNHPLTRKQAAEYLNKILELAHETFGGFGSEGPFDHVAKHLDYALYVSAYPKRLGAKHQLMDRIVPLWQIVYHGIILSNPFYSSIDYPYKDRDTQLKVIEFGVRPSFYYVYYKDLSGVKRACDEYQPLKYLQLEFMEHHGAIADDVFLTKYSDGSEIVTNYSDDDFTYQGKIVSAGTYHLLKPGD